jgi:hypothetical protein
MLPLGFDHILMISDFELAAKANLLRFRLWRHRRKAENEAIYSIDRAGLRDRLLIPEDRARRPN